MKEVGVDPSPARGYVSFFEWLCRRDRCAHGERKQIFEKLHDKRVRDEAALMTVNVRGLHSYLCFPALCL
jgi:hypothetical protein